MTSNPRILELAGRVMSSEGSPEEVCRECPELLPQVLRRLRRVRAVEDQVNALFPPPTEWRNEGLSAEDGQQPRIPGYEIESLLGRGGMGVVFKARHTRLNRSVALKMLVSGVHAGPRELERFFREAEAVASLQHPNIVQVHDMGEYSGQPYFTMEFVEGGSLAEKLAGTPQPARSAASLVATLAAAVHAAHERGIVHRDLKPSNVLLGTDGTPKVSDFGLARRVLDGQGDLTFSGARLGTPSYMAPEQAAGHSLAIGPLSDVYSLGAILYEMLTGRPPFRGESAADTERQVIADPPVLPSRLNPRVPRDLETVCLRCLQKDPKRRYASARELSEDLRRFGQGAPVFARRTGRAERLIMWARRRPSHAALVAVVVVLLASLAGAATWLGVTRSATLRNVDEDFTEIAILEASSDWTAARATLLRARARLGGGGPAAVRARIDRTATDLDLGLRLDELRLSRVATGGASKDSRADEDAGYESAFVEGGLGRPQGPGFGGRVSGSAIRPALVAALDFWATIVEDPDRRRTILEAAMQADPDAGGWRDRVRDPASWNDTAALVDLARTVPARNAEANVPLSITVAMRLGGARRFEDEAEFLRRVQHAQPADFWVNYALGHALIMNADPDEAVRFLQAALALRPTSATVCNDLGVVMGRLNRMDESIAYYRLGLEIGPPHVRVLTNLGIAFGAKGQFDEEIRCYQQALQIDPDFMPALNNYGVALAKAGNHAAAVQQYERAVRVNPEFAMLHFTEFAQTHYHYGNSLLVLGRTEEAISHYETAIRLDPSRALSHMQLGIVLAQQGKQEEALGELERTLAIDPGLPAAHFNLGTLLASMGRYEEAIRQLEPLLREQPDDALLHKSLGQAYFYSGDFGHALASLRRSLELDSGDESWRQFATQLLRSSQRNLSLEAILPDVLSGTNVPKDGDGIIEFAELCRTMKRYGEAARLYDTAFRASPRLANDIDTGNRYNAACMAVLASADHSVTSGPVNAANRAQLRALAIDWLRADLVALKGSIESDQPLVRSGAAQTLSHWRIDTDLAAIRDPELVTALPGDEQIAYRSLWEEVSRLLEKASPQGE